MHSTQLVRNLVALVLTLFLTTAFVSSTAAQPAARSGVVIGADDGDTVAWGTSCSDPSCTPVIWNAP